MATISFDIGLQGTKEALTLLNSIVNIVQKARDEGNPDGLGIADIINQLPNEAFKLAGQFEKQVSEMKEEFLRQNIDLSLKIDDYECNTGYWNSKHDKLLINFQADISAITAKLANFLDDVVAVARCSGEEDLLARSYETAMERKLMIRRSTNFDLPLEKIFDNLINHAGNLRAQLGDMKK